MEFLPKKERKIPEEDDRALPRESIWKIALREVFELARIFIVAILIVIPVRLFVFQTFTVNGASMEPSYHNADYLIIDELTYHWQDPVRGEVIVFRYPEKPSEFFIKRVIGLPGETVEIKNGVVLVGTTGKKLQQLDEPYLPKDRVTTGGEHVELGPNQFYVLGDNRNASLDSRSFGPLDRHFITGRSFIRGWPFDRVAYFKAPEYHLGN